MYLQLHDGAQMSNTDDIPNIPLPQSLKVDSRAAIEEAAKAAVGYVENKIKLIERNEKNKGITDLEAKAIAIKTVLPKLKLQPVTTMDAPGALAVAAKLSKKFLIPFGKWLIKNADKVFLAIKTIGASVPKLLFNRKAQQFYDANKYNVQSLNSMSRRQIEAAIPLIDSDMVNAQEANNKTEAAVLAKFHQVYELRKEMLPLTPPLNKTLLYLGGGLLAYYLIKKK